MLDVWSVTGQMEKNNNKKKNLKNNKKNPNNISLPQPACAAANLPLISLRCHLNWERETNGKRGKKKGCCYIFKLRTAFPAESRQEKGMYSIDP